jgi:hypothetical protein
MRNLLRKKVFLLVGVVVVVVVVVALSGAGCAKQTAVPAQNVLSSGPDNTNNVNGNRTELVDSENKYTNKTYGFSLTFPMSWGGVTETEVPSFGGAKKETKTIRLASKTNPEKYVNIGIIKTTDTEERLAADDKMIFLAAGFDFFYYYQTPINCEGMPSCQGDTKGAAIYAEIKEIVKSFEQI